MLQSSGDELVSTLAPMYFRAVDRLRLEGYVLALTQGGMSLSMVSSHEAILDHYGEILLARLRLAAPQVAVEVYFPASSEALLARFNEILVNCSIQDAMNGKVSLASPRIWIVHDASALPDHEIQLLARLVQHFPAANIRVVLLMPLASQKPGLLSSFGRSILSWDIEPPSPEQAEIMLAEARVEGRELAVRALLRKLSLPLVAQGELPTEAQQTIANSKVESVATAVQADTTLSKVRPWGWLLGGMAMLTISTLLVAMYYVTSHRDTKLNWNWDALLTGRNPMVNDSLPGPTAHPPQVASSSVAPEPQSSESSPVNDTSPTATATATLEMPSEHVEITRSNVVVAPIERASTAARTTPPLVGLTWVENMPKGALLVQHIVLPTYPEATQWLERHPELPNAQVVALYWSSQKILHYVVATGPFESFSEAKRFLDSAGVSKGSQIRSAQAVKDQFDSIVVE